MQELIKYKSNQVSPVELESVVMTVQGVKDVGVIGVPQGDGNELPRAYVVRADSACTQDAVQQAVRSKLANHKWLRGGVRFVEEIPRNTIGKIDRKILKQWCDDEAKRPGQDGSPKL